METYFSQIEVKSYFVFEGDTYQKISSDWAEGIEPEKVMIYKAPFKFEPEMKVQSI